MKQLCTVKQYGQTTFLFFLLAYWQQWDIRATGGRADSEEPRDNDLSNSAH